MRGSNGRRDDTRPPPSLNWRKKKGSHSGKLQGKKAYSLGEGVKQSRARPTRGLNIGELHKKGDARFKIWLKKEKGKGGEGDDVSLGGTGNADTVDRSPV